MQKGLNSIENKHGITCDPRTEFTLGRQMHFYLSQSLLLTVYLLDYPCVIIHFNNREIKVYFNSVGVLYLFFLIITFNVFFLNQAVSDVPATHLTTST